MALNLTFGNAPVMSKVKIGEQIYWLKDAELRALVDAFGSAVQYNVDTTVSKDSANLITSGAVQAYVTQEVAGLAGAMHFVGVEEALPASGNKGDIVIVGTAEYVFDGENWILIGDEGVYATIAGVEAAYVKKTLTIAGINLEDAITADELKTALDLKALAHKDNASGSIDTIDSINDIIAAKAGEYAVAATPVAVPVTYTELDVTPAGSVALPGITVTHSATAADVATVVNAGTAYSITDGAVAQAAATTGNFAIAGMIAAIDESDAEMLVLSAAATGAAVTAQGEVSYTAPVLSGALPTFGTASVVGSLGDATAAFNGEATFTGAEKKVTPAAATTANAAGADAKVTVADATIAITANKSAKTVTVQ